MNARRTSVTFECSLTSERGNSPHSLPLNDFNSDIQRYHMRVSFNSDIQCDVLLLLHF